MKIFATAAAAAILCCADASARSYEEIMKDAQGAFAAEDFAAAGGLLDEAQLQRPYSLYLTRNRVLTRVLTDRMDDAIAIAQEIAERGLALEMPAHEAFDRMKAEPAFAAITARMAANMAPIGDARVVLDISDTELLPEAIVKGRQGATIIGSVRTGKIIEIGSKGSQRVLATADGGVFDVEPRGNAVWAVINNQLAYENAGAEQAFASVMAFDRETGARIREIRAAESDALLGDLEIAKDGTIYASDSITPRIYRMTANGETLDVFTADARLVNPQGLALVEKRHRLFLADYLAGLFVIDTESGAVTPIANPSSAHLGGIDGLYYYKGSLIGVQNGTTPQRIVRIALNKAGDVAERLDVLAQNLEGWNEPTHGYVDGDEFVYIATSNWPAYDDESNIREGATLAPLRIMSAPLE